MAILGHFFPSCCTNEESFLSNCLELMVSRRPSPLKTSVGLTVPRQDLSFLLTSEAPTLDAASQRGGSFDVPRLYGNG